MSEYQRYEWMTSDRALTRAQREAVNALSTHIEVSSTRALVEYHWSNFRHDPLQVLHDFFDGFLYWANWGAPELALRFPHGALSVDLLDRYDLDEFVTFTQAREYDILDIRFGELEAPREWVDYELGTLIALREELMDGDERALYIVWLASECLRGMPDGGDQDDAYEDEDEDEVQAEDDDGDSPPIPPNLGTLTSAQQALAELLQVPQELLVAAARYSSAATASTYSAQDIAAWVTLLPPDRSTEYLVRLAHGEPGLNRVLLKELRELGQGGSSGHGSQESEGHRDQWHDWRAAVPSTGGRVPFATLRVESRVIRDEWEHEQRERLARARELQEIHEHQDEYWHRAELAVGRGSGAGYDEAARILGELRTVAMQFEEVPVFDARFRARIQPHLRRPAFVKRLQERGFSVLQGWE
jgi:hypothetical protein